MTLLPEKDPSAVKDYGVKWSDWLLREGDEINTSTWTVEEGLEQGIDGLRDAESERIQKGTVVPNSEAYFWASGGEAGVIYRATNRITTAGGRTEEQSIWIPVAEQ